MKSNSKSGPKCGKFPPIRLWFSTCVAPYGHGGDCQFDPLPALTATKSSCKTCGNDLQRVENRFLKFLLAEMLLWWEKKDTVDSECGDLMMRVKEAIKLVKSNRQLSLGP